MIPLHKVSSASARDPRALLQLGDDSSKRRGNTPEGFGSAPELKKQNTSRSNLSSNSSKMQTTSKGGVGGRRAQ